MAGGASQSREHARQPIELEISYKRLNAFFSDYTRNISKGGTFIKTDKPLEVGTGFLFKLHVPGVAEPLRIAGQVQWVRTHADIDASADPGSQVPGMGIRFVYRDEDERETIERQIEKIMVDSLGQRLYARLMEISHSATAGSSDEELAGTCQDDLDALPPRNRES